MTGKDFTDEVLASKYLNACMFGWGTKTTLRIWGVDHNPELAMPTQEIYAMVKSYKNKPTIANPDEPFGYRYIAKKRLLAILSKRMEEEKEDKGGKRLAQGLRTDPTAHTHPEEADCCKVYEAKRRLGTDGGHGRGLGD